MIKCDWFWKLLKQWFFTLLISCFILLGGSSVSAASYDSSFQFVWDVWLDSYYSSINSNFTYSMLKWWGLLSSYIWISKAVLALDKSRIFWRSPNWYPYAYLKSNVWAGDIEWFFDRYYVCELMTWTDLNNCTPNMIDYSWSTSEFDKQVFVSFFNTVNQWEKFFVSNQDYKYIWSTWDYWYNFIRVCWNSEEIWNTFCFMGWRCYWWHSICNTFWSLVNSEHLKEQFQNWLDYWLLAQSWIWKAPWQLWYNDSYQWNWGQWSVQIWQWTITITWDYVFNTCTNWDIISSLEEEWYNKYMCYWWINTWTNYETWVNYNPIPLSWLSLHYILSHDTEFASYDSWFTYFYNLQQRTIWWSDVYLNKWTNYPAVYKTYFDLFFEYWGNWFLWNINDLNQYCWMVDSVDYNQVYNWNYFRNKCSSIISSNYNWGNYAWSGQYSAGVNWGSDVKPQTSAVEFIQDFFNKLNEVLPTDYSDIWFWALPVYIITFMIALIFFRFLMK